MQNNTVRTVEHHAHGFKFIIDLCREQDALAAYAYRVDGATATPVAPRYVAGTNLQLHHTDFQGRSAYLGQHLIAISIADIDSGEYTGLGGNGSQLAMNRLAVNPHTRPRP